MACFFSTEIQPPKLFTERGSESRNIGDKIGLPFQNIKLKVSEILSLVVEKHLLNEVLISAIVVISAMITVGNAVGKLKKHVSTLYITYHMW